MTNFRYRVALVLGFVVSGLAASATPARALDRLCDPAYENCRTVLINYIRAENPEHRRRFLVHGRRPLHDRADNRFKAGVKVRVIMDLRANDTNQFNAQRLAELQAAGIPMRGARRAASCITR